jgi:hypothetical protein
LWNGAARRGAHRKGSDGDGGKECGARAWTDEMNGVGGDSAGGFLLKGRRGTTERGVGGGGPAAGRHAARGWALGLAPTGGRRADAVDAWAPVGGGRGSEERGAGHAWAGPGKRGVGRAQMNSCI